MDNRDENVIGAIKLMCFVAFMFIFIFFALTVPVREMRIEIKKEIATCYDVKYENNRELDKRIQFYRVHALKWGDFNGYLYVIDSNEYVGNNKEINEKIDKYISSTS